MDKLKFEDFKKTETEVINVDLDSFNSSVLDLKENVERPPLALSIGYDDRSYGGVHYPLKFGTLGNFSLISGKKKSRKSFVKSLLEACAIGGKSNNYTGDLEIKGYIGNKWVICIDTEQSKYDALTTAKRVPKMVGSYCPKYKALFWREKSLEYILAHLDWLFMESPYKDDLGIVVIDGLLDLVYDPNDRKECKEIIDLIMKYSSVCNCHIICILHLNPDGGKMVGWLGSIAGRKAETTAEVENMGEYSKVICKDIRGGKPFKDFTIRIDDDWMPYISDDNNNLI